MAPESNGRNGSGHRLSGALARLIAFEAAVATLDRESGEGESSRRELPAGDFFALCFTLSEKRYAIALEHVQETVRQVPLAELADCGCSVAGMMNLRGQIVPVVDGRARFQCSAETGPPDTPVIVMRVRGKLVGLIVDTVVDVVDIRREQVSTPEGHLRDPGVAGELFLDDSPLQLVAPSLLLDTEELESVQASAEEAARNREVALTPARSPAIDAGWGES